MYDAIFCLSVLRHGRLESEQLDDCAEVLPFARFAQTIDALDRNLKPGGLLFLWGCNFRFADTAASASYVHIPTPDKRPEAALLYGPDNKLLPISGNTRFVFQKQADPSKRGPESD